MKDLDGRGVPGGFVASDVFKTAAATQGEALGFHPDSVFVAHPIQDRSDAEMRELGDAAFDAVFRMVCVGTAR